MTHWYVEALRARTVCIEGFLAVFLGEGILGAARAKGEVASVAPVRLRAHAHTCSHAACGKHRYWLRCLAFPAKRSPDPR